jgi:hypothetical protein
MEDNDGKEGGGKNNKKRVKEDIEHLNDVRGKCEGWIFVAGTPNQRQATNGIFTIKDKAG